MRERRRDYELMLIVSPIHANEEGITAVIERVQQAIEAKEGVVSAVNHSSPWGRRKLAYPIRAYAGGEASRRNFTEGYYILVDLTISAAKLGEVERTLRLTDALLRYLVMLVDRKPSSKEDTSTDTTAASANGVYDGDIDGDEAAADLNESDAEAEAEDNTAEDDADAVEDGEAEETDEVSEDTNTVSESDQR